MTISMKAAIFHETGAPLRVTAISRPAPGAEELFIAS